MLATDPAGSFRILDLSPATEVPLHLAEERVSSELIGCPPPLERASTPAFVAGSAPNRFVAVLPIGVWKRVALYPALFALLGNFAYCGGLPTWLTVIALAAAGIGTGATFAQIAHDRFV